jgi:hypothetical protein
MSLMLLIPKLEGICSTCSTCLPQPAEIAMDARSSQHITVYDVVTKFKELPFQAESLRLE